MKCKTNKEIKYGNVEVGEKPFDPKHTKIKITAWLDADVILALREHAARSGSKYQTLMNHLLREAVLQNHASIEERLARIEKELFKNRAG